MGTQPTSNEIKQRLYRQGYTLKSWAAEQGFNYRAVSETLRGVRKGNFGEGREIRLALGLPVKD